MPLQIIGAGLGRTGTESLKIALEKLGYGKCYHMFELMKNPHHLPEWLRLKAGKRPDYDRLFDGYGATMDFPACMYYREFLEKYPDAKVVLTVRDAAAWYGSASKTIFRSMPAPIVWLMKISALFSKRMRGTLDCYHYAQDIVHKGFFENKTHDPAACQSIFEAWNEEVKRRVPPEKLLVFQVKDGWEPLCRFLEVSVPSEPFPRSNESKGFVKNVVKKSMGKEQQGFFN